MFNHIIGRGPKPSKSNFEFKLLHSFEKRKKESTVIKEKFPDMIPIIVEKSDTSDVPDIDKHKYLIHSDLTIGQFLFTIRQKLKIASHDAIFFFVDNSILPTISTTCGDIYNKHKDKDGFLYITYATENTFG